MNTSLPYQQNPYSPRGSSNVIQCYRCGDTCKGEVVRVHNNHFHIRCFTCQVCGCGLAQSGFFFKNQEYICTQDYQQLYGTRCDSCRDFITGEVISALGRTYHPKCFVCSLCKKPFPIGDKVTFSGKECLCQTCSQSMTSSKPIKIRGPSHCAGCKEEIKHGQSLLALDKQWHVSCFKCQTCSVILTGEYISKDGVPYCESDYHSQFGIKCETCDRYISGRVLEAGGKHYHPTCARCVRCHQMFTEGEEMYLTGSEVWHPICKQAARAEKKLKHRRTSETSISPPGSSIGSPNRVICDIYENLDLRQRRASSPGYIDSPTYSRQGMSPTFSAHLITTTAPLEKVTSTGNPRSTSGMVICRQQPRAKQVKTSARPRSTVQPTHQTPTTGRSLSTGPTTGPPKCPEPGDSHPEERRTTSTAVCTSSRVESAD